jgi:hypothetical protein
MKSRGASRILQLALVAAIAACAAHPRRDVYSALSGQWGWTSDRARSCGRNPHALAFSADRHFMILRHRAPIKAFDGSQRSEAYYRVLQSSADSITMALEGETRHGRDGRTVVWELRLLSESAYCWRRTDKSERSCSAPIVRCE